MPSVSRAELSGENEPNASCFCAFLCDNDGEVIRDFGELTPCSREPISAHSLVGRLEPGALTDFLETVRTGGATLGSAVRIQYRGSASSLLLQGCQTPCGILIFATLALGSAALSQDRPAASANVEESLTRNALSSLQDDSGTKRAALINHEEDMSIQMSAAVHDLKNPISSIINACEYLTEYSQESLDPVQLEMIRGIESAASTLLRLSDRISNLCKQRSRVAMDDPGTPAADKIRPASDVRRADA